MALEDKDIFMAICARYPEQSMEFVMEQYAMAKKKNAEIEQEICNIGSTPVLDNSQQGASDVPELSKPQKKYTKRDLKVKPQDAITDDIIYCCICGAPKKHLSSKHLATHNISKEDYKKLCGYSEEVKLMSKNSLSKSREIMELAQQKRMDKKDSITKKQ